MRAAQAHLEDLPDKLILSAHFFFINPFFLAHLGQTYTFPAGEWITIQPERYTLNFL